MLRTENPAPAQDLQGSGNLAGYASFEALCCPRPRWSTPTASKALAGARAAGWGVDGWSMKSRFIGNYPSCWAKLSFFSAADCCIIDSHEGQETYSQAGRGCPLPRLWRGGRARSANSERDTPAPSRIGIDGG